MKAHPPAARERLDVLLVEIGLAASRERARALIMAGQVLVNGTVVDKAGTRVAREARITVAQPPPELRYVSRGGLKLEAALDAFGRDVAGRRVLDVGASTGGFTDVVLQRGAARVWAVDVGQGQLAWQLRRDPRVVALERTNIRSLEALPGGEQADCAVVDVSFISLRQALPPIVRLISPIGWIVALVKPQFEAGKREADRGRGIIRDRAVHLRVLSDLIEWIATDLPAMAVRGLIASPIAGRDGNREFLLWLDASEAPSATIDLEAVLAALPSGRTGKEPG
jgi:23S rRNA (cytidine1920-2'-O)/16S rRNA (cytidine1409-2'-O)-methyltransferase